MNSAAMTNQAPAPLPLRWRRLWLLVISLGLLLCVWQAAHLAREQALSNLQDDAENELRLSARHLNGYLLRYDYLPQMLATREGWKRFLVSSDSQTHALEKATESFPLHAGVSDSYCSPRGETMPPEMEPPNPYWHKYGFVPSPRPVGGGPFLVWLHSWGGSPFLPGG